MPLQLHTHFHSDPTEEIELLGSTLFEVESISSEQCGLCLGDLMTAISLEKKAYPMSPSLRVTLFSNPLL